MKIDKTLVAKRVTSLVVGAGVSNIVRSVIEKNVDVENRIDNVTVTAATLSLSMMISDLTRNYTDTKIDAVVATYQRARSKDEPTD